MPSLKDLIQQLRSDAQRVASEHKRFTRRPRGGGYGNGRRMQPDPSGYDVVSVKLPGLLLRFD